MIAKDLIHLLCKSPNNIELALKPFFECLNVSVNFYYVFVGVLNGTI